MGFFGEVLVLDKFPIGSVWRGRLFSFAVIY